ncbi:flavin reductase family protein, partial [Aspergillus saccharolyticus JOP 1030-1]
YPTHKVNRLLEPGPVVLVTTGSLADRTHNIMTMGFHMMIQHEEPTLIGACIGPWDKSFDSLKRTGQCVLAVPAAEILQQVVDIGNCSGETVDKWKTFKMIPPDKTAHAPLVGGEYIMANIQCVVHDRALVATYNLWVLRVVRAWVNRDLDLDYGQCNEQSMESGGVGGGGKRQMRMVHHRGDGRFVVDGAEFDLRHRM